MNNLSCIPFYKTQAEQDFRLWYAYGDKFPNYVPGDFLVPFFIPFKFGTLYSDVKVDFYKACCSEEQYWVSRGSYNSAFSYAFAKDNTDFSSIMKTNGLVVKLDEASNSAIIAYYAREDESLNLEEGMYYMVVSLVDGRGRVTAKFYSDVFVVKNPEFLSRKVMIEWSNKDTLFFEGGFIPYGDIEGGESFKNRLYLDTTIGMPEYKFTEDGEERNGRFFPIKQISEKVYKMSFYAPEYLCDVMRLIRMADYITIKDDLGRTYDVEQFEMEVNWSQGGHYAEVACSFQTNTVVKKIGKAYNI